MHVTHILINLFIYIIDDINLNLLIIALIQF